MKLVIHFEKIHLAFGIGIFILLAGLISVIAYAPGNPSANPAIFGHSANEVEGGAGIPSGMIGMFNSTCPSGWSRFSELDGKVPRGSDTYGGIGGSETHTHDHTDTYYYNVDGGSWRQPLAAVTIHESSSWPPYLNVVWCMKN